MRAMVRCAIVSLLFSVARVALADIAFVVEPHRGGVAALLRAAVPVAVVVFGQVADVREAVLLDAAFCLTHGKAVRSLSRCGRVATGGGNSLVVVPCRLI